MEGLGLLIGHLLGDYIVQNDWMASNKTNPHPGPRPEPIARPPWTVNACPADLEAFRLACEERNRQMDAANVRDVEIAAWDAANGHWRRGHLACAVHCAMYTLAIWACSFWWMPWWGLVACFAIHFPVDRFRLAGWWMKNVSGQVAFATGPLSPWSIIVVDNTFHLLTLFIIAAISL